MGAVDYILISVIAAVLVFAVWLYIRGRKKGGCCGNCAGCAAECSSRKEK